MPDSVVSNEEFVKKKVTYKLIKDVTESQANFFGFDAELGTSSNAGEDVSMFDTTAIENGLEQGNETIQTPKTQTLPLPMTQPLTQTYTQNEEPTRTTTGSGIDKFCQDYLQATKFNLSEVGK